MGGRERGIIGARAGIGLGTTKMPTVAAMKPAKLR
jgi:hypothetical protein